MGGVIPFAALAVVISAPLQLPGLMPATAIFMLTTYAAVIISFIGAVHWGIALADDKLDSPTTNRLFVYSVIPSLLAWLVLLLPEQQALFSLAAIVAAAWVADRVLVFDLVTESYAKLRSVLTLLVTGCLLLAALSL